MVSWCGQLQEGIWEVRKKMDRQRKNMRRKIILLHRNM
jgi:hypothetical protein